MKVFLPNFLLFGFWGAAPLPNLLILAKSQKDNTALIAHEEHHQLQQRRDGVFKFWFNYLTNKEKRFEYELDAYKIWLAIAPEDKPKVIYWLSNNYGIGLSHEEITQKLD